MKILRAVAELRHWSREARKTQQVVEVLDPEGGKDLGSTMGTRLSARKGTGFSPYVSPARSSGALAPGVNPENLIGLVPTMGALHAGHASLIRAAASACKHVAVSIFVNPTQFGPNEDYARYPRSFDADCAIAEAEGATAIFAPAVEEMYPTGAVTYIHVDGLSERLDGLSRPGHFRGVATVVAKLFNAAESDLAFFGQKDAAQIAVLRRMVTDLGLATKIVVCPIVRESDGLALSSRNIYLSPAERTQALILNRTIRHIEGLVAAGQRRTSALIAAAREIFATEPAVRVDYIELVDWDTLQPVDTASPGSLFAVAAWVGATRLIDNTILS